MAAAPPDYGDRGAQGDPGQPQPVPVVHVTPTGITIREEHTGWLHSLADIPFLGGCFSSIRCCACHDGIGFVPATYLNTNWCLPYHRYALYNDDRLIGEESNAMVGPEAITANGVRVQLSEHARIKISQKRREQGGKVFKVTFTKFNPVECFCFCCAGCCSCCDDVVVEDMIVIDKIWYGSQPQTACLDLHACTRALLCCLPLFGCCEPRVNLNIRDVAYNGAPTQQYMG
jgi:hypothetical protein